MDRSVEITGRSLFSLFYVVSLAGLVSILALIVPPLDDAGSLALAALLVVLTGAGVVGFWRRVAGREGDHLGTVEDIAYDPFAYPGHIAKHNWVKAVRGLRVEDGDEDE
jgi:hypothetical protein